MSKNYEFGSGFTGTSYGEGRAKLAHEGKKAYDKWEDNYYEAQERLKKKSRWGSGLGLLAALGGGLLTGGMSTAAQMAIAGGTTLAGRGVGSAAAGKKIKMKRPSGLLFHGRKYDESAKEMKEGYKDLTESAFSSALTNAMTTGLFNKFKKIGPSTINQIGNTINTSGGVQVVGDVVRAGSRRALYKGLAEQSSLKLSDISPEINAILYGGL